jgi:hypothetical protein
MADRNEFARLKTRTEALDAMIDLARSRTLQASGGQIILSADSEVIARDDSWKRIVRGLEILKVEKLDPDYRVLRAVSQSSLYCSIFADRLGIVGEVDLGVGRGYKVPPPGRGPDGAIVLAHHFVEGAEQILPESHTYIASTIECQSIRTDREAPISTRLAGVVDAKADQKAFLNTLAEVFSQALADFRQDIGLPPAKRQPVLRRGPSN